ncbi:uncharacterized protein LOC122367308 [Amphibalanus amphitrite]|uniref:uncharacterized protein LOC122367308 n=1 Tax=Amphibalanus amphitrite TaxID=1232801 RepID=UPI001C90988F|nr:uncharacterized protein LOC122367308 [Amphibalanus amphitrite]
MMARGWGSAALVATGLLCCWADCASAGTQQFVQRVIQSETDQAFSPRPGWEPDQERFAAAAAAGGPRRRITRVHLPASLGDALSQAMAYEANLWRFSRLRWKKGGATEPPATTPEPVTAAEPTMSAPPPPPASVPPPLSSAVSPGRERGGDQPELHLNITESSEGCACPGLPPAAGRTVTFRLAALPAADRALLELHVPVLDDQFLPPPAGTVTVVTRLAVCGPSPAGGGRSLAAPLRLKRAPGRPHWRHAIVSDWLAQLRAGAAGRQCLQLVLPAGAGLRLDRSGYRAAHLTARPPRRRRA